MTYIYLSIPIGFTLLILFAIEHLFDAFSSDLIPKNTKSEGKES